MKKLLVGLALVIASILAVSQVAQAQTAVIQSLNNVSNKISTFTASALITPATSPNDILTLSGSATKTVYVKTLRVACLKTAGGFSNLFLMKRSTATTGGTSSTISSVAHDSSNSAATAVVTAFTANPTPGTGVSMAQVYLPFGTNPGATAFLSDAKPSEWLWGTKEDQYIVLRGAAQMLAVNLGSTTLSGATCTITLSWMEY